jgi:hypothetical protein
MAHRRKHRRHARENPLGGTTIAIAVGAAAVVGIGYYLYKRQQAAKLTAPAQQFAPQLGGDATRGQPPPGANTGGSSTTNQQQQQQTQLFKLGDVAGSSTSANTSNAPPPVMTAPSTTAMSLRQAASSIYVPPAKDPNAGIHAPRTLPGGDTYVPPVTNPMWDPFASNP